MRPRSLAGRGGWGCPAGGTESSLFCLAETPGCTPWAGPGHADGFGSSDSLTMCIWERWERARPTPPPHLPFLSWEVGGSWPQEEEEAAGVQEATGFNGGGGRRGSRRGGEGRLLPPRPGRGWGGARAPPRRPGPLAGSLGQGHRGTEHRARPWWPRWRRRDKAAVCACPEGRGLGRRLGRRPGRGDGGGTVKQPVRLDPPDTRAGTDPRGYFRPTCAIR